MSLWDCLDESQRALLWYEASMPVVPGPEQKAISRILKRVIDQNIHIPLEVIVNTKMDEIVAWIYHKLPGNSVLKRNVDQVLGAIDFPSVSAIANRMRQCCAATQGEVVLPVHEFARITREPTGIDPYELIEHPEKIESGY